MSTIEMVIFCLAVIWTPGLAFMGYLLLPKPRDLIKQVDARSKR